MNTEYLDQFIEEAREALEGILDVLSGKRPFFYQEYPCHSPWQERWFALRATRLADYRDCVVVSHEDISDRICGEVDDQ